MQVSGPGHRSASQGPCGPPGSARRVPRSPREAPPSTAKGPSGDWREGSARAPQPAPGQRKELLFLSSRWGFCCINQLSEEPNTIKPKQSPKLGGGNHPNVHSVGDAGSVGGDAGEVEGKKVDGASISAVSSTGGQGGQLH